MQSLELLPDAVEVVVLSFGTVGLSLFGAYVERLAVVSLQDGNLTLGLWAGFMGLVLLAFAYAVGRNRLAPKLAALGRVAAGA